MPVGLLGLNLPSSCSADALVVGGNKRVLPAPQFDSKEQLEHLKLALQRWGQAYSRIDKTEEKPVSDGVVLTEDHALALDMTRLHEFHEKAVNAFWQKMGRVERSSPIAIPYQQFTKQVEREQSGRDRALELLREEIAEKAQKQKAHVGGTAGRMLSSWVPALESAIQKGVEELGVLRQSLEDLADDQTSSLETSSERQMLLAKLNACWAHLALVPARNIAFTTIALIFNKCISHGNEDEIQLQGRILVTSIARIIGQQIASDSAYHLAVSNLVDEQERLAATKKSLKMQLESPNKKDADQQNWEEQMKKVHSEQQQARSKLRALTQAMGVLGPNLGAAKRLNDLRTLISGQKGWDMETKIKVGALLVQLAVSSCQVYNHELDTWGPAFSLEMLRRRGKSQWCLGMSPAALAQMTSEGAELRKLLATTYEPMVVPPMPWQRINIGGYLTNREHAVKVKAISFQKRLREEDRAGRLTRMRDVLTVLGSTPWRINRQVYQVFDAVYSMNDAQLNVQVGLEALNVDTDDLEPDKHTPYLRLIRATRGKRSRASALVVASGASKASLREFMDQENHAQWVRGMISERVNLGVKKVLVDKLLPEESFYFPHTIDFRGRAYPLPTHLNHVQGDLSRGLITFAEEVPLGDNGFKWLQIHAANSWGNKVDKLSYSDRIAFIDQNLYEIRKSAADPLGPEGRWWTQGEKPWQLLAACFEIAGALKEGLQTYKSSLPVHQDGSCNGLQHYAALARDRHGGEAVNVLPSDLPQDVYTRVMNSVVVALRRDAEKGDKYAQLLVDKMSRKIVKQPVMTTVYGVTNHGMSQQILSRLEEIPELMELKRQKNMPLDPVAVYLAGHVSASIGEVFNHAQVVMEWLKVVARRLVDSHPPHVVTWRSPMGFIVEQPYLNFRSRDVTTPIGKLTTSDTRDFKQAKVLTQKQAASFPPNFIHSLDSSHMMMTAEACFKHGITFAGVHDSFWTHAGHADELSHILRDAFIELHSTPQLEVLRQHLAQQYPDVKLPPLPPFGDLDLELVRQSKYFFC